MTEMKQCSYCGSKDLEKLSEKEIVCKSCGFGFGNTGKETPANMKKHIENVKQSLQLLKVLFPTDTQEQTTLRFSFHQHRVEKHPTNNGYCDYCNINWNQMSKEEFKERLGYDKDKWEIEN